MNRFIRMVTVLAVAGLIVGACAAAAATPTPSPTPVPAASTAAPVVTPQSTLLVVTPMPVATSSMPADPKAPAYATVSGGFTMTGDVTRTKDGDCERVSGGVVEGWGTASDARLSGTSRFDISGVGCGGIGFEYGTMRIENAGGAWEGFCSGGIWNSENSYDLACWLSGSGAYEGLTTYYHSSNASPGGPGGADVAVILPMPAPKQ